MSVLSVRLSGAHPRGARASRLAAGNIVLRTEWEPSQIRLETPQARQQCREKDTEPQPAVAIPRPLQPQPHKPRPDQSGIPVKFAGINGHDRERIERVMLKYQHHPAA